MTKKTRGRIDAGLEARIALEALREQATVADLALLGVARSGVYRPRRPANDNDVRNNRRSNSSKESSDGRGREAVAAATAIPTNPATHSNRKLATDSDLKPAGVPI